MILSSTLFKGSFQQEMLSLINCIRVKNQHFGIKSSAENSGEEHRFFIAFSATTPLP